jgi:hypothetical protein
MPRNAVSYDHVDLVLPLTEIPAALLALATGEALTPHRPERPDAASRGPV